MRDVLTSERVEQRIKRYIDHIVYAGVGMRLTILVDISAFSNVVSDIFGALLAQR